MIRQVEPVGEPFNDALFLCASALQGGEEGERALTKINGRLHLQSALLQVYQSNVVTKARDMGFGLLPFVEAATAIGEEFGTLRDVYLLQLREIML